MKNRNQTDVKLSRRNNKLTMRAFTMIELIVVIAVIAILVLLAMPRFANYTEKARAAQIVNDIKVLETKIDEYLIRHEAFPDTFIAGNTGGGKLFDRTGPITTTPPNLKVVNGTFIPESKLDGDFFTDEDGNVVYEDKSQTSSEGALSGSCALYIDNLINEKQLSFNSSLSGGSSFAYFDTDYVSIAPIAGKNAYDNWYYFSDKDWNVDTETIHTYKFLIDDENWFYVKLEIIGDTYTTNEFASYFDNYTNGMIATIISKDGNCGSETHMLTTDGNYLVLNVTIDDAADTYTVNLVNSGTVHATETFEYIGGYVDPRTPTGGTGTIEDPYEIWTLENLAYIGISDVTRTKHYKMMRSLDYQLAGDYASPGNKPLWTTSSGWIPIPGTFSGSLDGNGFTLSNLYINSYSNRKALFSYVSGSITDMNFANANIRGKDYTGVVAGEIYGGALFENINIIASVVKGNYDVGLLGGTASGIVAINNIDANGAITAARRAGGILGETYDDVVITNVKTSGTATAGSYTVGGIVGKLYGYVRNSSSSMTLSSYTDVGGIAGVVGRHNTRLNPNISNTYFTGVASATDGNVGGIVGHLSTGAVTKSYNLGTISANRYVGGIVGRSYSESIIADVYNLGAVSGTDSIGGVLGNAYKIDYTSFLFETKIYNAFSSGNVVGTTNTGGLVGKVQQLDELSSSYFSSGNNNGTGQQITTEETLLESTFAGWDFETVWRMEDGPKLR